MNNNLYIIKWLYRNWFVIAILLLLILLIVIISAYNYRNTHKTNTIIIQPHQPLKQTIILYFFDVEQEKLVPEKHILENSLIDSLDNQMNLAKQILNILFAGSDSGYLSLFPDSVNVEQVYFDASGNTIIIDFDSNFANCNLGGTTGEIIAITTLIKTIHSNFPSVEYVQILIDGHPTDTFGKHINARQPFIVKYWINRDIVVINK